MKRFLPKPRYLASVIGAAMAFCLVFPAMAWGQEESPANPHRARALELVVGAWQVMSVVESKSAAQNSSLELLEEALRLLRQPEEDGGFRYARLSSRQSGEDSRSLRVRGTKKNHGKPLVATDQEVFRFGLFVGKSAGVFRDNNRVYVKTVVLHYRTRDEDWRRQTYEVNRWLEVGQNWYQDLPQPALEAKAEVTAWCETPTLKKTFLDLMWAHATLEDLPANPDADLVKQLKKAIAAAKSPYLDRYYNALKPLYEEVSGETG